MQQPGIEVRPLREMTGRALFNEVFLDEARVPNENVIGGLGAGWAVANSTLMFERASLGGGGRQPVSAPAGRIPGRLEDRVGGFVSSVSRGPEGDGGRGMSTDSLVRLAKEAGCTNDPIIRQEIVQLHILAEVNKLNMRRAKAGGSRTGAEGNLAKLAMSELVRRSREVGLSLIHI